MSSPPRKPCNVTRRCTDKKGGKRAVTEEETFRSLIQDRDFGRLMIKVVRPSRSTNISWLIDLVWFVISFLAGLVETRDGYIALGWFLYSLIIFIYLILLSIVPVIGIFTLLGAGSVESSLASSFSVNLNNPWIAFFVNGLYVVLGWIIQVIILTIIAIVAVYIAASAGKRA